MQFSYRAYNPERDRTAVRRIWSEVGWLEPGKEGGADALLQSSQTLVADIDGQAECLVATVPGSLRYLEEELPFTCIAAVTTSRIARRQGLARRLTAAATAEAAAEGAAIIGLGAFELGFYDQLGFGSGGYEHYIQLDPLFLRVRTRPRVPQRLTTDDWAEVHASRLRRARSHGALQIYPPEHTRFSMMYTDKAFGLGFHDGPGGAISHHLWCEPRNVENGPYSVSWLAYQTPEQLNELLGVIRGWGDQVDAVTIQEPAGVQLQDLVEHPMKCQRITAKSPDAYGIRALAEWQMRICDLPGCLARTHFQGETLRFNLRLADPIDKWLDGQAAWRGISGEYTVEMGAESTAKPGSDPALPTLTASVGAFTRMWLGVRPATGISITDDLSAPPDLLQRLDTKLRLPDPKPDWGDF